MASPAAMAQRGLRRPPNIVLILADDLGYGDLGAYGNKANRTPNLNRLAREGVRFTDFHSNGPMCTPTRTAIMTGRYQNRFGREFESAFSDQADQDRGLPAGTMTVAGTLKSAGYATAMYGKWHLGYHAPYLPTRFGFDDFRGVSSGDGDHHSHIDRGGRKDWWHNEKIEMESGYTAELVTRHGVAFIEQNRNRPFFLYLPHLAIHFPWQGPGDKGYRIEGRSYNNLSKLGDLPGKDVALKVREMVEAVDESVGQIVAALERHGLSENTLVFFTADNGGYLTYEGGYHNISSNGPLRGQKGDVYEGGHRVPGIAWWPGKIKPAVSDQVAMSFDLFPTFAALAGVMDKPAGPKSDGVDLCPLLLRREPLAERTLFWRMGQKKAVRQGNWKLVVNSKQEPELYQLQNDLGEQNNRASEHSPIRSKLLNDLAHWEAEVERSAAVKRSQ